MRTTLPKLIHIFANFLCLAAFILSAACSKNTLNSTQPTLHPTAIGQPNVQEDRNVLISFATNEYQRGIYEPLIEEFNQQNPEITVMLFLTSRQRVSWRVRSRFYNRLPSGETRH